MKRIIIAFILIASTLLCLSSCNKTDVEKTFDTLNTLAQKDYLRYTIEITVVSEGGDKVTETYRVSYENGERTVKYRTEKINAITANGDSFNLPDEYITVTEGTLSAEKASSNDFDVPSFSFSNDALSSVVLNADGTGITAEVASSEAFMGKKLDGKNVTLDLKYNEGRFSSITLAYTSSFSNNVTIKYIFE